MVIRKVWPIHRILKRQNVSDYGVLTKISDSWYRLDVGEEKDRLVFFGPSEAAVRAKHKAYARQFEFDTLPRNWYVSLVD